MRNRQADQLSTYEAIKEHHALVFGAMKGAFDPSNLDRVRPQTQDGLN